MHARELVELAVVVGDRGRPVTPEGVHEESHLHHYWVASRSRFQRWHETLQEFRAYVRRGGPRLTAQFPVARPIIDEILMSEVLTRVWTAEAQWLDLVYGCHEVEPIARNVFVAHEEVRHRTLSLMTFGVGFPVNEMLALNRLRRSCERWTDMLLGGYADDIDVSQLAFDANRVQDYAAEKQKNKPLQNQQWQILVASARVAFEVHSTSEAATPDANRQIAEAIVPFLNQRKRNESENAFLHRMNNTALEAQEMVDELLLLDEKG